MTDTLFIQGRCCHELDLQGIRQWLGEHPDWSRWRLSRELATRWDWRNGAGQLKDMAARTLLVKLEQRGLIDLPPRRQVPTNRMRCRAEVPAQQDWDERPIQCELSQLGVLSVNEVSRQAPISADHFVERVQRDPAAGRAGRKSGELIGRSS